MQALVTLTVGNTHLYLGALLTIQGAPALDRATPALLLFSDHHDVEATLTAAVDAFVLRVDAHVTVAGTHIERQSWRLEVTEGDLLVVRSRIDPSHV